MLGRQPGPKTKRKYQQRNKSPTTSTIEALTNFCHYFKNVDFLKKPLRHYLFIYLFWVALSRQNSNSFKSSGRPMLETEESYHLLCCTPFSRFCTHRGALYENYLSIKLSLIIPCSMVVYYLVQNKRNTRHEDNQLFQSLLILIQIHPILFSKNMLKLTWHLW